MKRILIGFVLLLAAINIHAQVIMTTQTVSANSQYTYSVNQDVATSTINFSITGGTAGTDYTIVSSPATSRVIKWLPAAAGKTITISAQEVNHTCNGGTVQIAVTVDGAVTASFASASSTNACSVGTDFTTQVNFSRTMLASEFPVNLKVDITVDAVTTSNVDAVVSGTGGTSGTLTIIGFDTNNSNADQVKSITIVDGGSDNNGGIVNAATSGVTHSKTIYAIPTTDGIYVQ